MKEDKGSISLQWVFDHLPVNVYWKDSNGVVLGCNQAQAEQLGFNHPSELVGQSHFDLTDDESLANCWDQNDRKVMRTGKAHQFCEAICVNGEQHAGLSSKLPLWDDEGRVVGILGVTTDIEEVMLKQKQVKLTLDNLIAHLPGHVYWYDKSNVFLGCNERQALSAGFTTREDIIGKTNFEMPWVDNAAELNAVNDEVMRTRKEHTVEEESKLADNKKSIFLSKKVPMIDQHNQVVGVMGISFDITDKKENERALIAAKEEAELANSAKTEFIRNMEHDIRTPLSGIFGLSSLLSERINDDEAKEFLSDISNSAKELLEYCSGIIDYSNIESGGKRIIEKRFSLRAMVNHILTIEKPSATYKQLDLTLEFDGEVPDCVIGDSYRLERILINIVSNAMKFTRSGYVKLIVKLEKQDVSSRNVVVKFIVEDTGVGIPGDKLEIIFQKFSRAVSSNRGLFKGQGLGLSIVKQFVTELDGELDVQSTVGVGSTFSVFLPFKLPIS